MEEEEDYSYHCVNHAIIGQHRTKTASFGKEYWDSN